MAAAKCLDERLPKSVSRLTFTLTFEYASHGNLTLGFIRLLEVDLDVSSASPTMIRNVISIQ